HHLVDGHAPPAPPAVATEGLQAAKNFGLVPLAGQRLHEKHRPASVPAPSSVRKQHCPASGSSTVPRQAAAPSRVRQQHRPASGSSTVPRQAAAPSSVS